MQEMGSPHPFFTLPPDNTVYQMLVTIMLVTGVTLWGCKGQRGVVFVLLPFALFIYGSRFHTTASTDRWWLASPWMMRIMNSILMDDERVLEQPMVLAGLSQRLVDHSVKFIAHHAQDDRPFFLYHSFTHVHIPMFTAANMSGRSKHGRYGDNVEEMDDGVGRILNALTEHGLDQHTLIYFTSDHGGHLEARENGERVGGYNGRFKGGKCAGGTEGGIRVPGIYRWSGHIPAGVTDDTPISMLDLLPTTLHLTGLPPLSQLMPHLPQRELDGVSIGDLMTSRKQLPPRVLLHHCKGEIHALRIVQGNATYKMQLAGYKFKPGSTQCGWGLKTCCSCYDVINYSHEPTFQPPAGPLRRSPDSYQHY
ncbi:arylsulfatase D-like [Homarus americanus]|uniref:Steryl-sulfatase-like 3 n=1 Tax=Homarus americanus TaxID=6706 RepID=A0A8J5JRP4_HOMAM|nr:arylsulfatase D-like [Homarus americanus]KAG7159688.1 Steryl-sulfatase-like 3 [Homarus americanus]